MSDARNFRGVSMAVLIKVLEGDGTTEHPFEEVIYVYQDNKIVGIIKPVSTND